MAGLGKATPVTRSPIARFSIKPTTPKIATLETSIPPFAVHEPCPGRDEPNLAAGDVDQRHLALLLEAQRIGRIGNWERDLRTNQLWWSDECYRLFGYQPGAIQPSYPLFLQHVHPEDRSRVADAMAVVPGGEPTYEIEYRAVTAAGETRHFVNHGRLFGPAAPPRTSPTARG
jgi:PAS domain-containing protein